MTLRTGLAILLVFLLFGVAVSQGRGYFLEKGNALDHAQRLMLQRAQSSAEILRQRLMRTRAFLVMLSAQRSLQAPDHKAIASSLKKAQQLLPPFTGLLVLDEHGRMVGDMPGQPCSDELSSLARLEASPRPQPFFIGRLADPFSCLPVMAMGYPLMTANPNQARENPSHGWVMATLSIQDMEQQLSHHGLGQVLVYGERGELLLTSGTGTVAPQRIYAFLEQNWTFPRGRRAHIVDHELLLGWVMVNQGAQGKDLPRLLVVSAVDKEAILDVFAQRLLMQWIGTAIFALILLAMLWRWARMAVLHPLCRLQEAAARLASDPLHGVKATLPHAPQELKALGRAFDDMASSIYDSLHELQVNTERYEQSNRALQAMVEERTSTLQASLQGEAASLMEERYHLLLDRAEVGMALVDQRAGNRVVMANRWFVQHGGGQGAGSHAQETDLQLADLFPGTSYEALRRLQQQLGWPEDERKPLDPIIAYPVGGGVRLPCAVAFKEIILDEGISTDHLHKQYLIVSCMDISAQKQLERQRQALDDRLALEKDLLDLANAADDSRGFCTAFVNRVQLWLLTQREECSQALYSCDEKNHWTLMVACGARRWPAVLEGAPTAIEIPGKGNGNDEVSTVGLPGEWDDGDAMVWRIAVEQAGHTMGMLIVHGARGGVFVGIQSPQEVERILREDIVPQLATTWISLSQRERLARYAHEQEQQARLLAHINQELERARNAKDEFLATMSHELRTPLNAIIGFSEALRDGLGGALNAEQLDYIQEILRASQHLLELINNILDLAKLESGKMTLEAAPTDMAELCGATQGMVRELATNKNITLTVTLDEALATPLVLDRRKVKQILLNLLSNAIKFTPMGGTIELRCSKVPSAAVLAHQQAQGLLASPQNAGQYLELRVQDSGIGISAEHIQRLFKPFEQLDSSLARHHEGTGLGLSLVKRFAELHGGLVSVASTPGEGSTFTVWLPWQEGGEGAISCPNQVPLERQRRKHALVVEDDPSAARLMALWLGQLGWLVKHARNGEDALRQIMAGPPDVVTLDVMLPGMSGWTLLKRLREQETLAHIPVLVVSVVASETQGFALGATAVIDKPLSQNDLLAALHHSGLVGASIPALRVVMLTQQQHPAILEVRRALEQEGHAVQVIQHKKELEAALSSWNPDVAILDLSSAIQLTSDVLTPYRDDNKSTPSLILVLQGDNRWFYRCADHGTTDEWLFERSRVLLDILQHADLYKASGAREPDGSAP